MIDIHSFNNFAWIFANILLAYVSLVVVLFVLMYSIFFDPRATTAGKMIFRFMLSLVLVMSLLYVGVFINPSTGLSPFQGPSDYVEEWRPIIRLVTYGYVAWTITNLALTLIMRKWFPHKIKTKADLNLVKPRHESPKTATIETQLLED